MERNKFYTLIIPYEVVSYIEDSLRYCISPYNRFDLDMILDIISRLLSDLGFNIDCPNKYPYIQRWIKDRINNLLFYSTPTLHKAVMDFYITASEKKIGIEVNINHFKYGDDYLISLYIIGDNNGKNAIRT